MQENNNNDKLDFRRYARMMRGGKWFYAVCLSLAMILAIYYVIEGKTVYKNYADMMLEEDQFGSGTGGLQSLLSGAPSLSSLFSISGFAHQSIDDEMELMASHECFVRTVRSLNLNRIYLERNGLERDLLYKTSPVLVEAPAEYFDTLNYALKLKIKLEGDGKVSAKLSKGFMGLFEVTSVEHQQLPFTLHAPTGDLHLLKSEYYTDDVSQKGRTITVNINGNHRAAWGYEKDIKIDMVNKKANAIRLYFKHADKQFAYDVMNAHVASYHAMHKEHRAETSIRQIDFLDDRIALLMNELDTVESGMKEFMKGKNLLDVENQAKLMILKDETLKDSLLVIETRLQLYDYATEVLINSSDDDFPSLPSAEKDGIFSVWNQLVVERNQLKQSAKGDNRALEMNRQQLLNLKEMLLGNIRFSKAQNQLLLNRVKQFQSQSANDIRQMPSDGLEYLNRERDLQVKNGLLLFLLQQRENAMMTMMSRSQTGYLYDEPFTIKNKDYTKKIIVALLLLFLAFLGPTFILWLNMKCKDLLTDDSDLPLKWRDNGRSTINDLRRLVMSDPDIKTLYMQPIKGGEEIERSFAECLNEVGAQYEMLHENDVERLMLLSDLKLDKQHRMILFVPSGKMKRKEFREFVKEVDPEFCYVLCQA